MSVRMLKTICVLLCLSGCGAKEPQVMDEYVHCRSLAGDRTALKMLTWEFDALSGVLKAQCRIGEQLTMNEIETRVSRGLSPELRDSLQDAKTSIENTLLELEVRGMFTRATDGPNDDIKLQRTK